MKYLGQAFKELREARHISLAKASGGQFSPSMLSKILKAERMTFLLKNYL